MTDPTSTTVKDTQRYHQLRRVTWVGAWVNALLALIKIVAGSLGHSQALVADGIHSLSDLATDALVLLVSKVSHKGADDDHPYGHARIETAATAGLALILLFVALGIGQNAIEQLLNPAAVVVPTALALVAALLSLASKEALYHYTLAAAKRLRSSLLKANAWHHRSDAVSSAVVLIGVVGSMLQWRYLDAVASLVVAVMIASMGLQLGWQALRELTDSGLEPEAQADIFKVIESVEGVHSAHALRTRFMGGQTVADVNVLVEPRLSVSEGHRIADEVRERLYAQIELMSDITVHIDPEDDQHGSPSSALPLRQALLGELQPHWAKHPQHPETADITLHYLAGQVEVEVRVPLSGFDTLEQLGDYQRYMADSARQHPALRSVQVSVG